MSLLPQRKKSPEEIAKLRESLGVPGLSPGEEPLPIPDAIPPAPAEPVETIIPAHHQATLVHAPETTPPAPQPVEIPHGPKPVHSLKRSERIPALPAEEPSSEEHDASPPNSRTHTPKPVRSLRKSEQMPVLTEHAAEPFPDSKLPFHRHSDQEISEIRRREALAMMQPVVNPKLAAAHPALLVPGYLCAIAGSSCFFFYGVPLAATAGCAATALLLAAFVFLRRPISRHHAAFIAVIALFVVVFGALHYFPHLQHAT